MTNGINWSRVDDVPQPTGIQEPSGDCVGGPIYSHGPPHESVCLNNTH